VQASVVVVAAEGEAVQEVEGEDLDLHQCEGLAEASTSAVTEGQVEEGVAVLEAVVHPSLGLEGIRVLKMLRRALNPIGIDCHPCPFLQGYSIPLIVLLLLW